MSMLNLVESGLKYFNTISNPNVKQCVSHLTAGLVASTVGMSVNKIAPSLLSTAAQISPKTTQGWLALGASTITTLLLIEKFGSKLAQEIRRFAKDYTIFKNDKVEESVDAGLNAAAEAISGASEIAGNAKFQKAVFDQLTKHITPTRAAVLAAGVGAYSNQFVEGLARPTLSAVTALGVSQGVSHLLFASKSSDDSSEIREGNTVGIFPLKEYDPSAVFVGTASALAVNALGKVLPAMNRFWLPTIVGGLASGVTSVIKPHCFQMFALNSSS